MGVGYGPSVVLDGLSLYLDAANPRSYPGSGNVCNDLSGRNVSATLNGTYSFNNNSIRLTNNISAGSNVSHIQLGSITNITTVSLWYYVHSASSTRYLLDMRSGGTGGWIYNSSPNAGPNWELGTLYMNGMGAQSITWANIEPSINIWRNVTVIANTPATDDMNLFSRNSDNEGYDVSFGAALVYNRVISQEENLKNFNALRGRYGI